MVERILVVDDEEVVLSSVRKVLRKDGYNIDTVKSADEALKLLKSSPSYDLVITDLMMPGMDGLAFLDHIRDMGTRVQTIMVTGYPTIETALRAKRLGAFEYITKPFTRQELRSVVVRAVRKGSGELQPSGPVASPGSSIPIYYIPDHSWVGMEPDGMVRVGMARAFASTVGKVAGLELPGIGDLLEQGRVFAVIKAADGVEHSLHAPMSGLVVEVNLAVVEDAGLAGQDCEGAGWLLRIEPHNPDREIQNLLPA